MEEQLVSFKTAVLAKKKEFNWVCRLWYNDFGTNELFEPISPSDYNDSKTFNKTISAPTQSLLQKWLREKYELEIRINKWFQYEDNSTWYNVKVFTWSGDNLYDSVNECGNHKSYEEALEVGLQEGLKLIK